MEPVIITGTAECGICGAAHWAPCRILERYAAHQRLLGRREGGITTRERALRRTGRAIAPACLLDATHADLMP